MVPNNDDLIIHPKFFRQQGDDGISTNWSKYMTAFESKNSAKKPADNAVLSLEVGKVRKIPMDVVHDPLPKRRAHSLIKKLSDDKRKKMRQRDELAQIAKWAIYFD